jgi:sulfotransferase family protein
MLRQKTGIFWVAAYPRSGNTWIRMFIFNLVRVMSGLDEGESINDMPKFSPWDADIRLYTKYLKAETSDIKELASVRHLVQRDIASSQNSGLVFAKTHWLIGRVFGYNTFNFSATAGAVYCIRNPLDVAISLAHHLDKSNDYAIEFMGTHLASLVGKINADLLGSWSENVSSWTHDPLPEICIIRYEDMIEDPQLWFGVLARHIFNPAPTTEQISEAIRRSSFQKLKAQEKEHGYVEQGDKTRSFFREGHAEQWKDALTSQQIDRIIRDHSAQMEKFGYLPNV